MSTIVAFGEDGAFYTSSPGKGSFWRSVPDDVQNILNGSGHTYFWLSMGPSEQYYVGWRRKDGSEFYELGDATGGYKSLNTKLAAISSLKSVKVIFGPDEGNWIMLTGGGGWRSHGLSSIGITDAIDASDANIKNVALGADDSWVALFDDGSVEYDLQGNYGSLENKLRDASDGDIKNVFLNPFNSSQFVVGYKNGGKTSHMPSAWADNIKF